MMLKTIINKTKSNSKQIECLYLHIGTHKTGTTALQHFFKENASLLKKKGVLYPVAARANATAHHCLARSVCKNKRRKSLNEPSFEHSLDAFKEESNGINSVLISSESFEDNVDFSKLKRLRDIAKTVKIIVYLRRQDHKIESHYSTYIKRRGYAKKIDEFIQENNPDYAKLCDSWAEFFGKENLIIRVYENGQFYGENIYSDFLNILGLDLTDEFLIKQKRMNISTRRNELEFKRLVNLLPMKNAEKVAVSKFIMGRPIIKGENNIFSKHDFISPQTRYDIVEKYSKSNSYVAGEYLERSSGKLFFEDLPNPNEKWQAYSGLSKYEIMRISSYIAKNSPSLIDTLCGAIEKGIKSTERDVVEAAKTLEMVLVYKTAKSSIINVLKLNRVKNIIKAIREIRVIKKSKIFDADWYLAEYQDVKDSGTAPVKHYVEHGWYEGRDPSPEFNTNDYLKKRLDVFSAGICPLTHYILYGKNEKS